MTLSQLGYSPKQVEEILRALKKRINERERRLLG